MIKLKVGLIGATQANFDGGKEQLFDNSVKDLKVLSEKMRFDFYVYPNFLPVYLKDNLKAIRFCSYNNISIQQSQFCAKQL